MLRFAGVDPAQGGVKRTSGTPGGKDVGDDFSISTWEVPEDFSQPPALVHMYRQNSLTSRQMAAQIHKQHMKAQYSMILMDPGGGGYTLRDLLREPIQNDGINEFEVRPIITADDDQMRGAGEEILVFFSRADKIIKLTHSALPAESYLPNRMHNTFRGALDAEPQGVRFPPMWDGWGKSGIDCGDPDFMRRYLIENNFTGRDRAMAEIDLALAQLITIERETGKDGKVKVDAYGMFQFKSQAKKDAAYAMLYGFYAIKVYLEKRKIISGPTDDGDELLATSETINMHDVGFLP